SAGGTARPPPPPAPAPHPSAAPAALRPRRSAGCCPGFAGFWAARAKTRSRWTCTRTGWPPPRPHAEAGTRAKCRGLEAQTRWLAQLEGPVTGASGVSFAKRAPARVWHLREVPAGRGLGNPQKGWLAEGLHLANIRAP